MRVLTLTALMLGCNDPGFDGVSIRPTYGWEDGCTDVTVGGHGFDEGISAALSGNPLTGIVLPDPEIEEENVGFKFTAVTPRGEPGFSDLVITNGDGQSATVANAFYYLACAGSPTIESVSSGTGLGGDTLTISGCGFAEEMQIEVVAPGDASTVLATVDFDLTCSTAIGEFVIPDLPDGEYHLLVTDGAGTVLYGANLCDSADTGSGCERPLTLTIGVAATDTGGAS